MKYGNKYEVVMIYPILFLLKKITRKEGENLMIEFKNVDKVYDDGNKAVDNLSLKIESGELVVFIGTSGSGKTTSMRMINRMIDSTNGQILIDGEDIKEKDPVELRRSIGYVIQQTGLMPHMTVYENIVMVPKLLKWDEERMRERAIELLKKVDMDPEQYMDRYPSELSGGQQQRIGVIRALAADQEIILMDEPFGALDPITREALQDLVVQLQKEYGRTVVFVTHDMDEALDLADKVAIMTNGQLIQYDTPHNIITNPANDFVREFIGEERLSQADTNQVVSEVMNPNPITVQLGTTISEAVKVMRTNRISTLFVTDENNVLYGIVELEKINRNNRDKLVDDIMEQPKFFISPDTYLKDYAERMLKRGHKYTIVLDDDYTLRGLLSRTELVEVVYNSIWGDEEDTVDADEAVIEYDATQVDPIQ